MYSLPEEYQSIKGHFQQFQNSFDGKNAFVMGHVKNNEAKM